MPATHATARRDSHRQRHTDLQTEPGGCPLCHGRDSEPFLAAPDRVHRAPGTFQLVTCRSCGLVYQARRPTPEALRSYYPPDYVQYAPPKRTVLHRLGWRYGYERYRRCRFVLRVIRTGTLLDVGCATGNFLSAARRLGDFDAVWGIEMSLSAARVARSRGLDVVVGRFEELDLAESSLDAVTMWDVLEHLPRPGEQLRMVRRALRPSGALLLSVPVLDSLDARTFGRHWIGLDVPRHLQVFTHATLAALLEDAGFTITACGHPTGSQHSFAWSLRLAAEEHVASPSLRAILMRVGASRLLRAALQPYFLCVESLGLGASLSVAARPRC